MKNNEVISESEIEKAEAVNPREVMSALRRRLKAVGIKPRMTTDKGGPFSACGFSGWACPKVEVTDPEFLVCEAGDEPKAVAVVERLMDIAKCHSHVAEWTTGADEYGQGGHHSHVGVGVGWHLRIPHNSDLRDHLLAGPPGRYAYLRDIDLDALAHLEAELGLTKN